MGWTRKLKETPDWELTNIFLVIKELLIFIERRRKKRIASQITSKRNEEGHLDSCDIYNSDYYGCDCQ